MKIFVIRAFTHLRNTIPDFTDNNLINIIRYGQDYYAASEINYINQIDPVTLETVGRVNILEPPSKGLMIRLKPISASFQVNYRNHIALNLATAHPHYDDEGNTYNMGTALMGLGRPKYVIFKTPAEAPGMGRDSTVTWSSEMTSEVSAAHQQSGQKQNIPAALSAGGGGRRNAAEFISGGYG